jgi:hypothetical protein
MRAFTRTLSGLALLAVSASGLAADFQRAFKTQAPAQPAAAAPAQQVGAPGVYKKFGNKAVVTGANAAAATAAPAAPEPQANPAAEIARGEDLYRRGEILQAAKVFEDRARAEPTPAEQSSTLFRLGVQWQGEASRAPAHQRADVRTAAISAYQQTLQINPNSGAALNNLAQMLRADPAKTGDADSLLARAVALNDSRKGVYLMNRAALKRETGDLAAATELAKQATAEDKGNVEAHQLVMGLLGQRQDANALLDYIRDLNSRGLVVRALESAAEGMSKLPAARRVLLISMARTIGSASYTADPWLFEKSDAGAALSAFKMDPAVGTGVNELFGVLRAPVAVTSLKWWHDGFDGDFDPAEKSPAEAMQQLTFRCGELYQAAGDPRAEGYYQMSVAISGRASTDPRALLGLAELLYQQKRFDDLARILKENEPGLMEAKRHTIAAADFLHTYQLRLALGMMYGYTQQWVNERQRYAASIWMLENARESAARYNSQANLPKEQQVKLPPSAVRMLSKGYASTQRMDRSVETRIEFANLYLESGQKRFAQQLLDAEWQKSLPDTLSAGIRQRLAEVTAKVGS